MNGIISVMSCSFLGIKNPLKGDFHSDFDRHSFVCADILGVIMWPWSELWLCYIYCMPCGCIKSPYAYETWCLLVSYMCVFNCIHTLLLFIVRINLIIYLLIYSCVLFIGFAPVANLTTVNTLV